MSKKARISQLAAALERPAREPETAGRASGRFEANPARGERGDFLPVTIKMPGEMMEALRTIGIRRRMGKRKNTTVSELLREAAAELIRKEFEERRGVLEIER